MSEIKAFINNKRFQYQVVKEEDYFDFIIEHDIELEKQSLSDRYRDHVFVTDGDKAIAYTCLMKDYDFPTDKTSDAITMATIYVNSNYRNQGISKKLIEESLNHIKNENKILLRTKPSTDGEKYSYNRITQISTDLNLPTIPHNLTFIYRALDNNGFFKNKNINSKIDLFEKTCNELLQHPDSVKEGIKDIDYLDDFMEHALNKILKNKKQKNKPY